MKKIFSRTSFFWLVNLIFMGVSVLHAGDFFGITGKDDFARYLGFAVSFFLDLVTIILMQAMLEARYRGEENRARQFLFFIVLCCGTSTFANLAMSLNDFNPSLYLPHAPPWVQVATPYILASFPLFVIMMSIAAEMIINVRPLEQLDEKEYEADEKKRLNLMTIRNDYLKKQAEQDLRLLEIRARMKANKMLHRPALSWPWQKAKTIDVGAMITRATEQLQVDYARQIESVKADCAIQTEALHRRVEALLEEQREETEEEQLEELFRRPTHHDEEQWITPFVISQDDENVSLEEQWIAPIDIDSRRTTPPLEEQEEEPKTNPGVETAKIGKRSSLSPDDLKRARRIVRRKKQITAQELADTLGISRSWAGKLKAQILAELTPEPA